MRQFYGLHLIVRHEVPAPKPNKVRGYDADRSHTPKKYDHQQMIEDRCNGMTWKAIGEKHKVLTG